MLLIVFPSGVDMRAVFGLVGLLLGTLYGREGKHRRRFWSEGATSKSEIQKDALMAKWVRLKFTTSPLFGLTCLMSIATNVYADGRCVCTTGVNTGYRPYCVPSASAL